MADNYLERHREDYVERKKRWQTRRQGSAKGRVRPLQIERPEDESL